MQSLGFLLQERAHGIAAILNESSPQIFDDQKHLDEGSAERAYWHYGYLSALKDVIKKIRNNN